MRVRNPRRAAGAPGVDVSPFAETRCSPMDMLALRLFPLLVVALALGAVAYKVLILKVIVSEGFTACSTGRGASCAC